MMYKISVKAAEDIENIWLYTFENWSTEQADKYIKLILDEIERLARHPDSGKDFSHIRKGYFRSKVKLHLIFTASIKSKMKLKSSGFYISKWTFPTG